MSRYGTYGHGLVVDLAVLGLWWDLMILKVFSNLNDSMKHWALLVLLLTGFICPDIESHF